MASIITIRRMTYEDLRVIEHINADEFTVTFSWTFYSHYLNKWPKYCFVAEIGEDIVGIMIGKAEGSVEDMDWHGHISAVSVLKEYRGLGIGKLLCRELERISDIDECFFVDLFVRADNPAVQWYERLGYTMYRRVLDYYTEQDGGRNDGIEMRMSLSRDPEKKTQEPFGRDVRPEELTYN
ncbi:hypothetical protein PCE1_002267 [Barthelona sp. PCE]